MDAVGLNVGSSASAIWSRFRSVLPRSVSSDGQPEPDVARYPSDLEHGLAHLHVPQLGVLVTPHQIGDSAGELRLVEAGPDLAHLQREGHRVVALALADREEQLEEVLLQAGSDPPDHPQVEQSDLPGVGHEHVAGMRIGVEEAVHQDLLEVRAKELARRARPRSPRAGPRGLRVVIFVPETYSIVSTREVV